MNMARFYAYVEPAIAEYFRKEPKVLNNKSSLFVIALEKKCGKKITKIMISAEFI